MRIDEPRNDEHAPSINDQGVGICAFKRPGVCRDIPDASILDKEAQPATLFLGIARDGKCISNDRRLIHVILFLQGRLRSFAFHPSPASL